MDPVTVAYVVCLVISEILPHVTNHQVNGFLHMLLIGLQAIFKIPPSQSQTPPLATQVDLPEPPSSSTVVNIIKTK